MYRYVYLLYTKPRDRLTAHLDEVEVGSGFSKNVTTLFSVSSSKIPALFVSAAKRKSVKLMVGGGYSFNTGQLVLKLEGHIFQF